MFTRLLVLIAVIGSSLSVSATIIEVPVDQPTIQQGIDASSDGDTVLIQTGTYVENINFDGHNIVLGSLFLTTGDTSYISQTIIDGDSSESVVKFENDENATTIISGFTIQNGYSENGGGINISYPSSPILKHLIVKDNQAINGGGIYGFIQVENCVISHNSAEFGGGCHGIYDGSISDCAIEYNGASQDGGGVFATNDLTLSNCIINGNSAFNGGGIGDHSRGAGVSINDCSIINNSAINDGGGVRAHYVDFINGICQDNTAGNNGGGIYFEFSPVYWGFNHSLFTENHAGNHGGAVYKRPEPFSIIEIYNCTFYQNSASVSGGALGGGTYLEFIYNSIFWEDSAPVGSEISGYIHFHNCNIQNGSDIYGETNIDCHPLFCNPDSGNFYLAENSCCLGTGDEYYGDDIGAYGVGCPAIINDYLPGDVNMYNAQWPPIVIGGDVTYLVNYFRSLPASQPCLIDGFWNSADANGDCLVIGSDVTRLVLFFRGQGDVYYCPEFPPMWLSPDDLPEDAPEGWPGCE
ncbi:MAG: hypothetical protein GY839_09340 [candidate division Zixibacteria bacterium]|nr:hypothetical protein [candidate division Zixibacteria bacterium]